jgi:hypothetical protein
MSPTNKYPNYGATWTWSDCPVAAQCRVLTATVGKRYRESKDIDVTGVASPSFTPTAIAGKLTSATGSAALCSAANSATTTCQPIPTGTI